jgi:hypothetical protein
MATFVAATKNRDGRKSDPFVRAFAYQKSENPLKLGVKEKS